METQQVGAKERLSELQHKYLEFCRNCARLGVRVNSATINEYQKKIQELKNQLN